jgi:hypothetical protein
MPTDSRTYLKRRFGPFWLKAITAISKMMLKMVGATKWFSQHSILHSKCPVEAQDADARGGGSRCKHAKSTETFYHL